ncbi:MAG: PKD domain-containing protein, partial [Methanobacteriota archaeon]
MTKSLRLVMCIILALFLAGASIVGGLVRGAVMPAPTGVVTSIHLVRTGASQASVLGTSLGAGEAIDVLVNSVVVKSGTTMYNGDYWFLGVPVSDGATIQTRIGTYSSSTATVPAFVPQPVGPPGFIYAQGSSIMRDGQVVQLFGVDEQTVYINGLIASGLWGTPDPSAWGKNQLFPSGPETKIPNVSDADGVFREYFRYFLHYNAVAGSGTNPRLNLLRVWVADDSWYPEGMYLAWKNNPTAFFQVFDRMVYWARQAGVYVVPVLGHFASNKDNRFFDTSDIRFSHQVDVVRGIMDRYNTEPQIAMWDLWNEPDVDNDVYWASVGGQVGFRAWATTYIAAVKPHSSNHLLTIGMGGWDLFPGVPSFGWQYEFFWNEIPGLQVGHHHTYGTSEDQYLIDWNTDWQRALGIPHYEGETGFNQYPGPSPLGYGYWPWFSQHTRSAGWASVSTMVFLDNGKGVYTDYPYLGPLPAYPNGSSSDLPPTASFVSAPGAPLPGDTVTFDASASTDDHGIASYGWQFGDSGTAQGTIVTHAYGTAGDFQAVVVVTDTGGNTATAAATIHVGAPTPNDTTAPANVVDLRVVSQGPTSVTLRWTAPGDDGTTGQATWYDVRYTTTGPITGSTYYAATHYDVAFPQPPGTTEQATVSGLTSGSS